MPCDRGMAHQEDTMEFGYHYDPIAGSLALPIYDCFGDRGVRLWSSEQKRWLEGRGYSRARIPMFGAEKPEDLFEEIAVAVGSLPNRAKGRGVLWFFGNNTCGLAHLSPRIKWKFSPGSGLSYRELPEDIRQKFPRRAVESVGKPGQLSPEQIRVVMAATIHEARAAAKLLEETARDLRTLQEKIARLESMGAGR